MTTTAPTGWEALQARLDQIEKPISTFKLCQDVDVRQRYLEAKQAAEEAEEYLKRIPKDLDPDARALVDKEAKEARTELSAAKKAYDAKAIVLRFTALERKDLERLQQAHPASEQAEADGAEYDMDTFGPALVSAASLDKMPVDYARKCLDTWAPGDARDLWQAAWSIQHTKRTDLGKG